MAHHLADKAEAGYQRGTLFPKRVKLMARKLAGCGPIRRQASANVPPCASTISASCNLPFHSSLMANAKMELGPLRRRQINGCYCSLSRRDRSLAHATDLAQQLLPEAS